MEINKTIKMFVGGNFIRSESGKTKAYFNGKNEYARVCIASKKDVRNAVEIANKAQASWQKRSGYNRGQILYRVAEMLQARESEFINLLLDTLDWNEERIIVEVEKAIETCVYYAGWCDKYEQLLSSVNPVNGPFRNFTSIEAMGTIVAIENSKPNLVGVIENIVSALAAGNAVISVVEFGPIVSALGEVFKTSDVPDGVVNLLSGDTDELIEVIAGHREVQGVTLSHSDDVLMSKLKSLAPLNMKRISSAAKNQSLDAIERFVEHKTLWQTQGF